VGAAPDFVELLHDFADEDFLVGDDAGLEVPSVLALGPHSGAGQIGAAGVSERAVNHHGLEMNARRRSDSGTGRNPFERPGPALWRAAI